MTNLEKKFYKHLNKNVVGTDFLTKEFIEQIARELAEIAEGENTELKEKLRISVECQIQTGKDYVEAADENYELKKQIKNIKYLNRGNVEKFVNNLNGNEDIKTGDYWVETDYFNTVQKARDWLINEICSLVIPITKEKIIEVLNKYSHDDLFNSFEQIASEIIGDDNND